MKEDIPRGDIEALVHEKYAGDRSAPGLEEDMRRLAGGEPLAYVIGHIPFLELSVGLASHPLIPRSETEWWTELLCKHIRDRSLRVLDLCAGSGAIGLAVLKHCPNAHVSLGEISPEHTKQIQNNLEMNNLDASRADIRTSDLFASFAGQQFDIIATNPPYIPEGRPLEEGVKGYEPHNALFAGEDGLTIIKYILQDAPTYLSPSGELWMECDIENIEEAKRIAQKDGAQKTEIRTDQYGRPRLVVAFY